MGLLISGGDEPPAILTKTENISSYPGTTTHRALNSAILLNLVPEIGPHFDPHADILGLTPVLAGLSPAPDRTSPWGDRCKPSRHGVYPLLFNAHYLMCRRSFHLFICLVHLGVIHLIHLLILRVTFWGQGWIYVAFSLNLVP